MQGRASRRAGANFTAAFALTFSLFALWGLGHRLYDTLLPQFVSAYGLDGFEAALTQNGYAFAYFFGAVPAALYARRFGYKASILFGLGCLSVGCLLLYPAAETKVSLYFIGAVAILSCGWVLLEVATNPLVMCLGKAEGAVRRLNLAQSVFPLGALAGVFVGNWIVETGIAVPEQQSAWSIVHPYIVIGAGVMMLAFLIDETRFPAVVTERTAGVKRVAGEFRALFGNSLFVFGIVAQFFSVMALAGTWSLGSSFFVEAFPWAEGVNVFVWSLAVFAAGRIAGTLLMGRITPDRLLAMFAGAGFVLSLVAVAFGGRAGAVAILASSFFLSITWPTVLGISIRSLGPSMKLGTALVCMGGAVGGVAYPMLSLGFGFSSAYAAMTVPAVCYAVLLAFAVLNARAAAGPAPAGAAPLQTA